MAPSETPNDGRGLTLRAIVLEVRSDVKELKAWSQQHQIEHATALGQARGEARVFGIARSTLALIAALCSAGVAIYGAVIR